MALSQYTKKALQRSIKCGILCILIPKHGFNIIRTSIVFLTLSRTQNNRFCLYIGGTSFNSHSGILVRPLAWKKDLLWHFFPGTGPHHPTPPHIYVKKNLGLKTLAQRVTDPWVFLQPRFGAGFVSCLSTDHSPSLAADSFADRAPRPCSSPL